MSDLMKKTCTTFRRTERGTMMAELPLAIWMLFVVLLIPMIDMATVAMRTTFLISAVHDAAHAAARSKSFLVPVDGSDPSAQQNAQSQITQDLQSFGGVKVTSTTVNIVTTNISSDSTSRQSTPLAAPADISVNTYSIEVQVSAQVSPFITYNSMFFGSIPCLSAPVTVQCAAQEFSEYPQGLNQ